jgi:hypothetical protein
VKFDADRRVVGSRLVILIQPSANFSSLYANYRVISGCVSCGALKEIHSYCAFLESFVVPFQSVLDYVRKKLLAALAGLKNGTVQDRVQFTKDFGSFDFIESAGIAIVSFAPNLLCYQTHGTHRPPFEGSCDSMSRGLLITIPSQVQLSDLTVTPQPNGSSFQLTPFGPYLTQLVGNRFPSNPIHFSHHTVIHSVLLEKSSTGADGFIPMPQPRYASPSIHLIPGKVLPRNALAGAKDPEDRRRALRAENANKTFRRQQCKIPLRNQWCSTLHMRRGGMTISSGFHS